MAEIRIVNLLKKYGELRAVDDLNYTFADGKVTCLLGPSGCGKTTLLRMIAGLETITAGEIYFGAKEITAVPTRDRNIGMVFQYPVVYRGLTAEENIAFPLKKMKLGKGEIGKRVDEAVELLNIGDVRKRSVESLSGVLRQKVSVAREVARHPDIILFDEPLTNLDASSKTAFKRSFKELTQALKQTIVYVTHDQTEAMTFGDYIALMNSGKIMQYDSPRELYSHPEEVFGGWFLGNPGMNFFIPTVSESDGARALQHPVLRHPLKTELEAGELNGVRFGVRPEHISVSNEDNGSFVACELLHKWICVGGQYLLTARVEDSVFRIKVAPETGRSIRDRFYCSVPMDRVMVYRKDGAGLQLSR